MSTREATGTPQRNTRQRVAVLEMLDSLTQFTSAQDIHARLRDNGSTVGLTTVYRTLQSLAEAAQVDVIRTDDGEAMYRRCTAEHHHHLGPDQDRHRPVRGRSFQKRQARVQDRRRAALGQVDALVRSRVRWRG
mgnify:CR=1 FL=1